MSGFSGLDTRPPDGEPTGSTHTIGHKWVSAQGRIEARGDCVMTPNAGLMDTAAAEQAVISTLDERGAPLRIVVSGRVEDVRRELAILPARGWARLETPSGRRLHLRPRGIAVVSAP